MAATGDGANEGEYNDQRPSNIEGDEEIMSKSLQIQSKRFYIDLKSNRRGKYIKISEMSTNRNVKRKVILTVGCGRELRDKLTIFAEFLAQQDTGASKAEEAVPEDGRLKSEMISGETKRYYLDLKENNRGRFLKVSQAPLSRGRGTMRKEIAIPAQGIVDIRNNLSEILEECGSDDEECRVLPKPCELRIEQKKFYFDVGNNARGVFLRISEVTANYRTSITIPKVGWARVRDTIGDMLDSMEGED
ncbi:transcriptional activator protein Pur-alpha [Exaiptasia diaphana]|uniref:Uncharacterized protein n=1 Tax=Exaiptasia diaphana TaxID=2652724 RepID=A0A913WQ79_EXADI|nr:transcriptional activator protein Pur-alpha [Exaiptasia diaphana]